MQFPNIPKDKAQPDAEGFIATIRGERTPDKPPLVEYIVDPFVMRPIVADLLGREWVAPDWGDRASMEGYLDNFIAFWHGMGYDFVRLEIGLPFAAHRLSAEDPAPGSEQQRGWVDQHKGAIEAWADFEAYTWPDPADVDLWMLEYITGHLPDGMGFITCHGGGPYEHLSAIMSYEKLCLALHDEPDLVRAVADRIGECLSGYYDRLLELPGVICIFQGDDMGFRSGTLLSPDQLREYTLPWQRHLAAKVHAAGKPYFLHSCGNLAEIMEDLIEDVGIDAKHSYEDAIMPLPEFQERYGDRIGVLGGVGVDRLAADTPEQVRAYVRRLTDAAAPRGRFAVGSGNSIPSYIPAENYLTMIDEAHR